MRTVEGEHVLETPLQLSPKAALVFLPQHTARQNVTRPANGVVSGNADSIRASDFGRHEKCNRSSSSPTGERMTGRH
ncbi:MAG TPA: hypothetical protein VGG44_12235 [Tepidisphaeraceae bacterium]